MKGDSVEQRLQQVVVPAHLRGKRAGAVVPGSQLIVRAPEPVRLVIDDDEAGLSVQVKARGEVDAAGEEAANYRPKIGIAEAIRIGAKRLIGAPKYLCNR